MAVRTKSYKKDISRAVLDELKIIRAYLEKLILLIPEESLKDYKRPRGIKKNYLKALKEFPFK